MAVEFVAPDFVSDNDPDDIQERMMNNLPEDIDGMPGGFPYDFTMPTALEKSELIQFHLVRTLMLMFPMWAWDGWLDLHASAAGIRRREAGYASGVITVTGEPGTRILGDTIFSTVATEEEESVEFKIETGGTCEIKAEGLIYIPVVAVLAGEASNVHAGTVILASRPIIGITKITNEKEMSGGTEEEKDKDLRERIQEMNETLNVSFVGNDNDYIRWSREVVGVGAASVVPEWDGPGTVKLIVTDANGQPANEHLLSAVHDYIMSPEDRMLRKAPIGAILTVVSPRLIKVSYSAVIKLGSGYDVTQVSAEFGKSLLEYYKEARKDGVIKYTRIASALSSTMGVDDFENLLVNGGISNIQLSQEQYPETDVIDFGQGTEA